MTLHDFRLITRNIDAAKAAKALHIDDVDVGRLFGFVFGWWTWLIVPLGGLALLAETVTGLVDRLVPARASKTPKGRGSSAGGAGANAG